MTARGARGALVLAPLVVVGLSACSGPEPSDEFRDSNLSVRVLQSVQSLNYPFESDPSYAVRVANLQTRLINECVEKQGIVPPTVDDIPLDAAAVTPAESRLWLLPAGDYGVSAALADPAVVASLAAGTGDGETDQPSQPPDPEAYDLAVYGPPESRITIEIPGVASVAVPVAGCFGEATKTLYGVDDAADYERAYHEVPSIRDVMQELEADGDVRRATSAWSGCMKDAGHDVKVPTDLYGTMSSWLDGVVGGVATVADVRAAETALAEDDIACRTSSGFGTTVAKKFLDLADEKIAGSEGVIQEFRSMAEHAQSVIAAERAL